MVTVLGTDVHWPRFRTQASRSPSGTLEQARAAAGSPAPEADSVAKPSSILYLGPAEPARCGSSVVEHALGNFTCLPARKRTGANCPKSGKANGPLGPTPIPSQARNAGKV